MWSTRWTDRDCWDYGFHCGDLQYSSIWINFGRLISFGLLCFHFDFWGKTNFHMAFCRLQSFYRPACTVYSLCFKGGAKLRHRPYFLSMNWEVYWHFQCGLFFQDSTCLSKKSEYKVKKLYITPVRNNNIEKWIWNYCKNIENWVSELRNKQSSSSS